MKSNTDFMGPITMQLGPHQKNYYKVVKKL